MAYTSVIPVRRLDRTVDYVQNKEKTTPKSLEEAVDYAANRDKTESACFETGLGCTTTSAFEDMRLNTLRWHKETGVQGYHLVQSFAEGEVTPELAHQIGVEFAEQLLHGKYQAIVTTHLNTKHYHNHIVWSAVSLEDGKKYHSNSKSYYTEVRALSDALCQKYGLSIIETPESLRGKRQYEKWRAEENNQPTWRTAIRQDVDEARRLLDEAGWKKNKDGLLERDGKPFLFTILVNQGNDSRIKAAIIIQSQLKALGITVHIRTVEWAAFIKEFVNKGHFDAIILAWTITLDPDIYDVWHSSRAKPGGLNFTGYRNAEVDELLVEARSMTDQDRRKELYDRVQEILDAEQPYCFLYVPYALPIVQARFQGIKPALNGIMYNFDRWWVPKDLQRYHVRP
mgnify:CR=1 FL=1